MHLVSIYALSFTSSLAGKQAIDRVYLEMCVVMFIHTLLLKKTLCQHIGMVDMKQYVLIAYT